MDDNAVDKYILEENGLTEKEINEAEQKGDRFMVFGHIILEPGEGGKPTAKITLYRGYDKTDVEALGNAAVKMQNMPVGSTHWRLGRENKDGRRLTFFDVTMPPKPWVKGV